MESQSFIFLQIQHKNVPSNKHREVANSKTQQSSEYSRKIQPISAKC